jgi:sterol 3beta-glucosyltransferase
VRITLFAHGLRGDVWPMVALGWSLARHDHEVTIAVPNEFGALAERAGLRTARLPFDMMAWLATPEGQQLLRSGGVRLLYGVQREFSRHAEELDDAHIAAAEGAQALITMPMTWDRAIALGEHLGIPTGVVFTQPAAPSTEYAPLSLTRGRLRSPALRRASHELAGWAWWRGVASSTRAFRRRLGLSRNRQATYRRFLDSELLALHTSSPILFPRPSDWKDHLTVTAAWQMPAALRDELHEGLPADLEAWLDAGEPPLFLGFGSMPVLEPEPLLADIAEVTDELGRRAIVSRNCVPPGGGALPEHLWAVDASDHDRLFPRCAAVVHHGGLGSTHASLRAGRPTMVCSVFVDQPWWGERVRSLGVGAHVPFRELNRRRLEAGLRTLLDPAVGARAVALGEAIRAEGDGLGEATGILEDWLSTAGTPPASAQTSPTPSPNGRGGKRPDPERVR